jgi:hypothetical protein
MGELSIFFATIETACRLPARKGKLQRVGAEPPSPRRTLENPTMSFQLSRRDVDSAYAYANRNMGRVRRDPESDSEKGVLNKLLNAGEVILGATAVGVASGRFGPLSIGNTAVPFDAVGGIALHLIGFWLDSPNVSRHLHHLGTGVLAGYGTKAGVGIGRTLRSKAGFGVNPNDIRGEDDDRTPDALRGYDIVGQGIDGYDVIGQGIDGYDVVGAASPLTEAELAALAQQVR